MQRTFRDDVHVSAEQLFEVLLQGHVIQKASPLIHVDDTDT